MLLLGIFFKKLNKLVTNKIHENSVFILSELVDGYGEQDIGFSEIFTFKTPSLISLSLNKVRPIWTCLYQFGPVQTSFENITFIKSTPSSPAKDLGNFFSTGSMVPGSGILRPQKNSLDLKICICRGIKSPKLRRIKYNWSTSDLPGHKASPEKSKYQTHHLHSCSEFWSEVWSHS